MNPRHTFWSATPFFLRSVLRSEAVALDLGSWRVRALNLSSGALTQVNNLPLPAHVSRAHPDYSHHSDPNHFPFWAGIPMQHEDASRVCTEMLASQRQLPWKKIHASVIERSDFSAADRMIVAQFFLSQQVVVKHWVRWDDVLLSAIPADQQRFGVLVDLGYHQVQVSGFFEGRVVTRVRREGGMFHLYTSIQQLIQSQHINVSLKEVEQMVRQWEDQEAPNARMTQTVRVQSSVTGLPSMHLIDAVQVRHQLQIYVQRVRVMVESVGAELTSSNQQLQPTLPVYFVGGGIQLPAVRKLTEAIAGWSGQVFEAGETGVLHTTAEYLLDTGAK